MWKCFVWAWAPTERWGWSDTWWRQITGAPDVRGPRLRFGAGRGGAGGRNSRWQGNQGPLTFPLFQGVLNVSPSSSVSIISLTSPVFTFLIRSSSYSSRPSSFHSCTWSAMLSPLVHISSPPHPFNGMWHLFNKEIPCVIRANQVISLLSFEGPALLLPC